MIGRDAAGRPRLVTQEEAEALARRIFELAGESAVEANIGSTLTATVSFARGDTHLVKEESGVSATIFIRGCTVITSKLDDEGITSAIEQGKEASAQLGLREAQWTMNGPPTIPRRPKLYYDELVAAMAPDARGAIMKRALDATEAAGLVGAGDVSFQTVSNLWLNTKGFQLYARRGYGEFSLTARTKDGRGSGWGWSGFEDWRRVDIDGVVRRAVDLAERTANPVAVEPGRYTVILEPTAVATLVDGLDWWAYTADRGMTPFSKMPTGTNKIGLQVLDSRINVVGDPWDPDLPSDTIGSNGDPVKRVVWVDKGYLRELAYDRVYAQRKKREPTFSPLPKMRWTMAGPTQTLDQMIASTKRGVWVNRLSNAARMNGRTGLLTGTTRDGTFLIEDGRITKAIKNFRFTESPFFVLNKLEAFGEPVRASQDMVVPRVKVRDFDFTSLTDAV